MSKETISEEFAKQSREEEIRENMEKGYSVSNYDYKYPIEQIRLRDELISILDNKIKELEK